MKLRYQENVVNAIPIDENVIIKMPTGSGKTYVAAEFILRGLNKLRNSKDAATDATTTTWESYGAAALFLVPTCDLVTQQKKALKNWIGHYEVAEYFGGKATPSRDFDVLVSTPQAFLVCAVGLFFHCREYTQATTYVFILSSYRHCSNQKQKRGSPGPTSLRVSLMRYIMS